MSKAKTSDYKVLQGLEYPRGTVHEVGAILSLTSAQAKKFADGLIEKVEAPKGATPPSRKSVNYYWLKSKAYVSGTERWDAGFYRVAGTIARLEGQPARYVEKFEGEVPEIKVYDMARHFLAKTEGKNGKLRSADELLEEIVIDRALPR